MEATHRKGNNMKLIDGLNLHMTEDNDIVQAIALRHLNVGDLVKRKPNAKAVYVINHRNKATKTRPAEYSLSDYEDMNREIFLKEDTIVYTGFTY